MNLTDWTIFISQRRQLTKWCRNQKRGTKPEKKRKYRYILIPNAYWSSNIHGTIYAQMCECVEQTITSTPKEMNQPKRSLQIPTGTEGHVPSSKGAKVKINNVKRTDTLRGSEEDLTDKRPEKKSSLTNPLRGW